jgi:hypothetical protein
MAKLKTERAFFDSQQQAAALLNVPIGLIRQAKREGCLAFRSGRVYVEPIKEWLARARHAAKRPRDNEREIRLQQAELRLERERYEFAQKKDRMLPVEQFELGLAKTRAAFEKELTTFGRRLNQQCEGLDFDDRAERIDREVRALRARLARCDYLAAD